MEADLILCISLFGTFFVGLCLPILVDKIISIFIKDEEKQEIVLSRLFNNPATPFLVILLSLTLIMWVTEGCVARNYHNIEKCEELRKIEEMKKIRQEEINKNIEKLGGV